MAKASLPQTCSILDCEKPVSARGWCEMHYCRWRRNGCATQSKVERMTPERFWDKSVLTDSGCWEYPHIDKTTGYGKANYQGRQWRAHRLAFLLHYGREASGMVLHSCDNPPCINPEHLRDGTAKENTRDMVIRNRNVASRSITSDTALEIKTQLDAGISTRQIAKNLATTRNIVRTIQRGESWSQVPYTKPASDGGGKCACDGPYECDSCERQRLKVTCGETK